MADEQAVVAPCLEAGTYPFGSGNVPRAYFEGVGFEAVAPGDQEEAIGKLSVHDH